MTIQRHGVRAWDDNGFLIGAPKTIAAIYPCHCPNKKKHVAKYEPTHKAAHKKWTQKEIPQQVGKWGEKEGYMWLEATWQEDSQGTLRHTLSEDRTMSQRNREDSAKILEMQSFALHVN